MQGNKFINNITCLGFKMEPSGRRRTKSYYLRKQRFMNKLQEYEVQTNQALRAQIKRTLKRKYSNTRKNRRERRIKGWWRIARINKARDIARKLSRLNRSINREVSVLNITFGEITRTKPSLEIVDGKFKVLNQQDMEYRLIPIEVGEQILKKERFDQLHMDDPRRKFFYKPEKKVIRWQDFIKKQENI